MKTQPTYTTQKQLRAAFREQFPQLNHRRTRGEFDTDTRCAFVDWIDSLARNGDITEALAFRATL
jgi:hypothetical protein